MTDLGEPKKETVRIGVSPANPQPSSPPSQSREAVRIHLPSSASCHGRDAGSVSRIDAIPMALCWALFAASAATLILQIWNYLS
jgi:hypothetical protein